MAAVRAAKSGGLAAAPVAAMPRPPGEEAMTFCECHKDAGSHLRERLPQHMTRVLELVSERAALQERVAELEAQNERLQEGARFAIPLLVHACEEGLRGDYDGVVAYLEKVLALTPEQALAEEETP